MSEREWSFDPPEGIAEREAGLVAVLKKARFDLTAAQAKVSEALRMIAALNLEEAGERVRCPLCASTFVGPNTLAEHVYTSHGGPLPATWVLADERVDAA